MTVTTKMSHLYFFFCHPSSLNVRLTAARHGLSAPSRRAGKGRGRRGADGLGQQERGGQSPHRDHVVANSMGERWSFSVTQRKNETKKQFSQNIWHVRATDAPISSEPLTLKWHSAKVFLMQNLWSTAQYSHRYAEIQRQKIMMCRLDYYTVYK